MTRYQNALIRGTLAAIFVVTGFVTIMALPAGAESEQVTSVEGRMYRILPDGERRMLACGELVEHGDAMIAGEWGNAVVAVGEVYAQVRNLSDVRAGRTADGTAEFQLIGGGLRVLDTREDRTSPVLISTEFAVATGAAQDTEVLVSDRDYITFCAGVGSLEVMVRGGQEQRIEAGECATMKRGDRELKKIDRSGPLVAFNAEMNCRVGTIIGRAEARFLPTDVAAPPLPSGFPGVRIPVQKPNRCDQPGRCGLITPLAVPPTIGNTNPTRGHLPSMPSIGRTGPTRGQLPGMEG